MSKKEKILEAASRVVVTQGVNRLTLEAVAEEANVSKGGLLYHYPNKEALIKAMNIHDIERFKELVEQERASGYSYHHAYLSATLKSVEDDELVNISTSLLATVSNDKEVLDLWREEYAHFQESFANENYKPAYTLLVKTVCDGLWFSKIFNLTEMNAQEYEQLGRYLLDLAEEASS